MKYRDKWELGTIPEKELKSEWAKRNRAKVKRIGLGGRPQKMLECEWCRTRLGTVEMKAHRRECKAKKHRKQ